MKKVNTEMTTTLTVEGIEGYMERKVTRFGNGAKIDCPKEYLGKKVFVVISKDR